ncbi:MAG: hypothetical protein AAF708_18085 [Deinococcota bacterium]
MAVFGSGGQAQNYIGFRNGDPLGNAFQMGIKSFVLSTLDMRVGVIVGSTTASDGSEDITFGVSVDMLAEVLVRRPWIIYVGAGGAVNYLGDGTVLEAHALAGIEVSLEVFNLDPLSVFLELNGGIPTGIGELNNTTIEENLYGALGINFYF